jgi:N-acetylmuramic acid 6-phosphate (MurNAc-6-P) etherase
MVDVRPTNAKLRRRAVGIVAAIAGVAEAAADAALTEAGGEVRAAVRLLTDLP